MGTFQWGRRKVSCLLPLSGLYSAIRMSIMARAVANNFGGRCHFLAVEVLCVNSIRNNTFFL